MQEDIRTALKSISSHKMRSFLTILGVIIGIASIIAIVSAIKGTNQAVMEKMIGAGNNNVTVRLSQGGEPVSLDYERPEGVRPVTAGQKDEIRALNGAVDATFYYHREFAGPVSSGEHLLDAAGIHGIDSHYLNTRGYEVIDGRSFLNSDYKRMHKAALLDEAAAEILFPAGGCIGGVIDLSGEPFTVVGLIRRAREAEPVIETLSDYQELYEEEFGLVLIPRDVWPVVFSFDEPEDCAVRADSAGDMSRIGREAAKIMNRSVAGRKDLSYQAEDLVEKARRQQELTASTNNLLLWVAGIALFVGGIGVMNIMLVTVTERAGEIGLKKALGAAKKRILFQFLTESAVLTGIGGVFGVAAGVALSIIISMLTKPPTAISMPSVFLGVVLSMAVGTVFGLIPSVKAAELNPIDALRRE